MRGINILRQSVLNSNENKNPLKDAILGKTPVENTGSLLGTSVANIDTTNRDYLTGHENEVIAGDVNESRAQRQGSYVDKPLKMLGRITSKGLGEIAKLPGVAVGGLMALGADEGEGWNTFVNNKWIQSVQNIQESVNEELLPVYVKKSVKEGDLLTNLTSVDFWATEGADGIGFIVSMLAPGAALKALNIGGKLTKFTALSQKATAAQKALGITAGAIDNAAITLGNTVFEAAAEAGSAMDNFEKNLQSRLELPETHPDHISEDEYNELLKQKATLGRDMFVTNMALLIGPNALPITCVPNR